MLLFLRRECPFRLKFSLLELKMSQEESKEKSYLKKAMRMLTMMMYWTNM